METKSNKKYITVYSEEEQKDSLLVSGEIGKIHRLEDLKYFVGLQSVFISASEILRLETELISNLFSVSLANGAKVNIFFPLVNLTDEEKQNILFKFLRLQNVVLLSRDEKSLIGEYKGPTVLPKVEIKPKKYVIADFFWDFFSKITWLRKGARFFFYSFLKIRERIKS